MEKGKSKKKPDTNFNDFWPHLKDAAVRQRLRKVEWMKKSSIDYQRFSEFEKGKRDVSARYFLRLIGGLNLKIDNVEKTLGRKFSDKQKRLLKFESKVDANRDWLEVILNDPEKTKICKGIAGSKIG